MQKEPIAGPLLCPQGQQGLLEGIRLDVRKRRGWMLQQGYDVVVTLLVQVRAAP